MVAAQLPDVGGSLAAARAMAMATKRVMVNTTIKFKWWHGREADKDKAMAMGIRVAGDEEGERDEAGDGVGDEGGVWSATKRAMALAARAMVTRVAGN